LRRARGHAIHVLTGDEVSEEECAGRLTREDEARAFTHEGQSGPGRLLGVTLVNDCLNDRARAERNQGRRQQREQQRS
jgi:hypothetical protein